MATECLSASMEDTERSDVQESQNFLDRRGWGPHCVRRQFTPCRDLSGDSCRRRHVSITTRTWRHWPEPSCKQFCAVQACDFLWLRLQVLHEVVVQVLFIRNLKESRICWVSWMRLRSTNRNLFDLSACFADYASVCLSAIYLAICLQ